MTEKRRRIGLGVAAALVVAALGVIIFVPGVGCQGNEVSSVSKQAKLMAGTRHRYESLSQYLDAKRKQVRKQREAQQKAAAAKSPRELTTFRVSSSLGIWNRFIWDPAGSATGGQLSHGRMASARKAAVSLTKRLKLASESAAAARLGGVSAAAKAASAYSGNVHAALAGDTLDMATLKTMDGLMEKLDAAAGKAGLKIVPKAPARLSG